MQAELDDFANFCRVERRLAPATCRAYERDVRACRAFLESEGIRRWGAVRRDADKPQSDGRAPAPSGSKETAPTRGEARNGTFPPANGP